MSVLLKKTDMNQKLFKKAAFLSFIPAAVNLAVSIFLLKTKTPYIFNGYIMAAVLCFLLSLVWLWKVKKGISANFMILLKFVFSLLGLKFFVFLIFMYGVFNYFSFDRMFFALAFLIATLPAIIIEVWFYLAMRTGEVK